jgi:hypothetical protein
MSEAQNLIAQLDSMREKFAQALTNNRNVLIHLSNTSAGIRAEVEVLREQLAGITLPDDVLLSFGRLLRLADQSAAISLQLSAVVQRLDVILPDPDPAVTADPAPGVTADEPGDLSLILAATDVILDPVDPFNDPDAVYVYVVHPTETLDEPVLSYDPVAADAVFNEAHLAPIDDMPES